MLYFEAELNDGWAQDKTLLYIQLKCDCEVTEIFAMQSPFQTISVNI